MGEKAHFHTLLLPWRRLLICIHPRAVYISAFCSNNPFALLSLISLCRRNWHPLLPRRAPLLKAQRTRLSISASIQENESDSWQMQIYRRARTNYTRQNPILINFLTRLRRDTAENKITSSQREKGESKWSESQTRQIQLQTHFDFYSTQIKLLVEKEQKFNPLCHSNNLTNPFVKVD